MTNSMDKTASRATCTCAEIAGENPDCAIHGIAAVISDLRQRSDGASHSAADWLEQYADDRRHSLRSLSDSVSDGSKGVRAKPLGWSDCAAETLSRFQVASVAYAKVCNFTYEIYRNTDGSFEPVFPGSLGAPFATMDEAKVAAQADYEQRILSALDSGTGGQQPEAWQGLNQATEKLVDDFASALKSKLRAAEIKYGYDDGWKGDDWETKCRRDLLRHVLKGDPLDVAAYAAFCWHHQWPTTPTSLDVAHFQLVALPPLYSSPTEPKAGVVSEDMIERAAKRICLATGLDWDSIEDSAPNDHSNDSGEETKGWFRYLATAALGDKP